MTPVFIFSLPRAGSTLFQRVICRHHLVASCAEPWILLPLMCAFNEKSMFTRYGHGVCSRAMQAFVNNMEGGEPAFWENYKEFILKNYSLYATRGESYFIDKTPRYYMVADRIVSTFGSNAKYIILWRNPLSVAGSIVDTFCEGNLNLHRWNGDLVEGPRALLKLKREYSALLHEVHYEELVEDGQVVWEGVFDYLGLNFNKDFLLDLDRHKLEGMGDPTGQSLYSSMSKQPLHKWKDTFRGILRRRWARSYLQELGDEVLSQMGYDYEKLTSELASEPQCLGSIFNDLKYISLNSLWGFIEPDVFRAKLSMKMQGRKSI